MLSKNSLPRVRTVLSVGCILLFCTFYWDVIILHHLYSPRQSSTTRPDRDNKSVGWSWTCVVGTDGSGACQRVFTNLATSTMTLTTCTMTCDPGRNIWPLPTGDSRIKNTVATFHPRQLKIDFSPVKDLELSILLRRASKLYQERISNMAEKSHAHTSITMLNVVVNVKSEKEKRYRIQINESYKLVVCQNGSRVEVVIKASSFLGAHHGLETLWQLIWWDGRDRVLKILNNVVISDSPIFSYRGLMLDTANNFVPVPSILRTVDAMSVNKMNVFHWHLTDSKSFPFASEKFPEFLKSGPYSTQEVYSVDDIREVVEYAEVRGVSVLVEVDAPAHTSQGWDWGEAAGKGNLSLCLNAQPFSEFCAEPPCGQLNPNNDDAYSVLVELLKELNSVTKSENLVHIGGDDLDFRCWESFGEVTDTEVYMSNGIVGVWKDFYKRFTDKLINATILPKYFIMWSNELVDEPNFWHKLKHNPIVQSRGPSTSGELERVTEKKFLAVVSTEDSWALSVPQPWQVAYYHQPWTKLSLVDRRFVLGGEVLVWTEQLDHHSLGVRVWPAAAAVAERLWTDPGSGLAPADRLARHRERMLGMGLPCSPVAPQWCVQNPNSCQ